MKKEELSPKLIKMFLVLTSVDTDSCIEWKGKKDKDGYGNVTSRFNGKHTYRCNRISYVVKYGEVPNDLLVLHKCDNAACINPFHLYLGTHQKNMLDRKERGRTSYTGMQKAHEKLRGSGLSFEQIENIRKLRQEGKTCKEISLMFNITDSAVSKIVLGKRRKTA